MGGPWLLGDTYLTVHRWFKGFNPWKTVVTSTMVWAQLPELPIEFINKEAVMKIGEWLGRPVRVDRATELGARGKYARVCVEVDLTQPLLSQFKIEGVTYLVQYEGLDDLCTCCGTYGKRAGTCHCAKLNNVMDVEGNGEVEPEVKEDPTHGQTYGDWMIVKRRGRGFDRSKEEGRGKRKDESGSNRFQQLVTESSQMMSGEGEKEADKGDKGRGEENVEREVNEVRDQPHAEPHAIQTPVGSQDSPNGVPPNKQVMAAKEGAGGRKGNEVRRGQGAQTQNGSVGKAKGKSDDGKKLEQKKGESKNGPGGRKELSGETPQKADGAGNRSPSVVK
ncbi:unnamed protein product [Linum tenue]|nr:unnamed protein product [Linum tenue]